MTVVNHWGKWVSDNVPVTGVVSLNRLEHIHDLLNDGNAINISEIDRWIEFRREKIRDAESDGSLQPVDITMIRRCDSAKVADYWVLYGDDWMATASDDPSHPNEGVWGFNEVSDWSKRNRDLGELAEWQDLPLNLRRFCQDQFGMWVEPTEEMIAEWREEFNQFDDEPSTYLIGSWVQGEDGLYEPGEITDNFDYAAIVHCDSGVAQVVKSRWAIRAELCSPCYPGQANIDDDGEFMGYDFPDWIYGEFRQNVDAVRFHRVDDEGQFWQVIAPLVNRMIGLDDNAITPVKPVSPMENRLPLYTITVQVRKVVNGVVREDYFSNIQDYYSGEDEGLFSATVQAPRGDLQTINNIARGLWNLADDQLRSIPD